jgi:Helicase HerA, central domain
MALIEKLGSFYLGKEYDLANKKLLDTPVNYDSRDLTTHAVCVGMTGSGKTGLCIDLLEEAALDNVPAILIDPKGDITTLLLMFPELRPEDFLPWINPDDAQRKGMSVEDFAAKTAQTWRDGLASWDQGPDRIKMLKDAADFAIYTPGSEAGLPVSILSSFQAPKLDWDTESETLRDRIQGTVAALLGLCGIEADPVRSREHIMLSTIFENAWRAGQDLDIAKLIMSVQKPPFRQVGVFDVDTFYPEKDRFGLAMALNNIIASPSFSTWLRGEALDIQAMLHTPAGKPRHSIFYIAHLNDAERMFFVTILLEQVISWMRSQPGTTSLRALLYMDEVFGFFPPIGEPPSKRPMLTLLKQARAFGLGVVLTTQNPVDLDYKGLTNAGTWFIGKLQAERDKARLLEGLQSVMAQAGTLSDTKVLDKLISSLDSRVFLLHDINLKGPVVFNTRWAMSYLRGPLTRQQVKQLMVGRKATPAAPTARQGAGGATATAVVQQADAAAGSAKAAQPASAGLPAEGAGLRSEQPPMLPPGIKQVYLPATVAQSEARKVITERVGGLVTVSEQRLVYEPALLGLATVRFVDRARNVDEQRDCSYLLPLSERASLTTWKDAFSVPVEPRDLEEGPNQGALFVPGLPEGVSNARAINDLGKDFVDHLYRNEAYLLAYNSTLKLYAGPNESERDFSVRCQQAAREARDAEVDKLRAKYEQKIKQQEERLAREEAELAQDKAAYSERARRETISDLSTVVGALGLFGRRGGLGRLTSLGTKRRTSGTAKASVKESEAAIARIQADLQQLTAEMEDEARAVTEQWSKTVDDIEQVKVLPKRTDIDVHAVAFAWAPNWEVTYQDARGRSRTDALPAYPTASQP